ncbi:MAG: gamma carbonic anhydrase family protein [Bacteroidota bacterium]
MALIKSLKNHTPNIDPSCFLAENATIVGDVSIGKDCSVWFNSVIRGDVNKIEIGNRVNIQDNAVVHCTFEKTTTKIGDNVSIGHRAIVHGCEIHDNVLIGMGAIVMDNVVVEEGSVIAAGAVVLEGTIVKKGSVFAGVPAKQVKTVSPELLKGQIERIAAAYIDYSSWYQD